MANRGLAGAQTKRLLPGSATPSHFNSGAVRRLHFRCRAMAIWVRQRGAQPVHAGAIGRRQVSARSRFPATSATISR